VIRNHHGKCLVACSELIYEVTTPELVEALAMRRAISLAGDEGFGGLQVVSDCCYLDDQLYDDRSKYCRSGCARYQTPSRQLRGGLVYSCSSSL
jgi:hypothetical protein